ncbi:hypothetical protein [Corynebacterium liangguodongii]
MRTSSSSSAWTYSAGEPFTSHIVADGNLYTGQNPASSQELATTIMKGL